MITFAPVSFSRRRKSDESRTTVFLGNVPHTGGNPGASTIAWKLPFLRGQILKAMSAFSPESSV